MKEMSVGREVVEAWLGRTLGARYQRESRAVNASGWLGGDRSDEVGGLDCRFLVKMPAKAPAVTGKKEVEGCREKTPSGAAHG